MPRLLTSIALRLAVCALVSYLFWRALGPAGLAISAAVYGAALARPIFDLVAELRHATQRIVYADIEGRHFAFHGHAMDVAEDVSHHRWVRVADVRKVIHALPKDAVLQRQYPAGLSHDARIRGYRINAEVLRAYLAKATDADSVKFRNWLEREVIMPAAVVRRRLGIRDDDTSQPD